jgi:cell division protein FtsQ
MKKKVGIENKLVERNRKLAARKWLAILKLFAFLFFFASFFWGLNYFYNSSYFKIKELHVEGNVFYEEKVIKDQIREVLGSNIFEIDKKKIEDRLIIRLSRLKEAEMQKVFPDRIVIIVEERLPLFKIYFTGNYFLIDKDGVIIDRIDDASTAYDDILTVRNAVDHFPEIGTKLAKKNVLSCANIYYSLDSTTKQRIEYGSIMDNVSGDIYFYTVDKKRIIFGNSEDLLKKNKILTKILEEIEKDNIKYNIIDLRITENPIIR